MTISRNGRVKPMSLVASTTPAAESYRYTSGTNWLASLTTSAGSRTFSYDNRGNTTAESRPGSISVATTYICAETE